MKILLLDNALDSFEWALRHLRTFLELDEHFEKPDISTTHLKQAILSLNAALELFFKERISQINPLLIYEHISTDSIPQDIIHYYCEYQSGNINVPLYNYIIENSEIHTIDYSKCIDLYCSLFSVPHGYKENFIALNGIRNKLTHLGINSKEEYYILAGRIANILNYTHYKILTEINYLSTYIDKIRCELLDIEFTLTSLEDNIWRTANMVKIESLCNQIDTIFHSEEISSYMQEKNVIADYGSTLDAEFMYGLFTMKKDDAETEIAALYASVSKNTLLLCDSEQKDGPVYAIFTLSNQENLPSKFYKSLDNCGTSIPDFDGQGDFWKNKPYHSHFAYVPFGKKQIVEVMKQIINYMSTVEFESNEN